MDVSVEHDEEAGSYSLGFTKDGVFVPVYSIPATHVDTIVASGQAAEESTAGSQAA